MSADFSNITILGGGLLGGSLALALGVAGKTRPRSGLWARRHETADAALELGIPGATSNLADAV